MKGAVINLTTDCNIKGEGNIGGFCAVNEGVISCCGAVSTLSGTGEKLNMGGFAAKNSGTIEKSYCATKLMLVPIPLIPIGILSSLLILIGTIGFLAIPPLQDTDAPYAQYTPYAPIVTDKNSTRIEEMEDTPGDQPNTEETPQNKDKTHRFSFRFNETIRIDSEKGRCYLDLKNPSTSSNKLVAVLFADDGTIMAESGGIDPCFGLEYLTLNENGYEKINSGATTGKIVLTAYDKNTNDKAMIDSSLPVTLVIE